LILLVLLLFGRKIIWPYQSTFTVGLIVILTFLFYKNNSGTKKIKSIARRVGLKTKKFELFHLKVQLIK